MSEYDDTERGWLEGRDSRTAQEERYENTSRDSWIRPDVIAHRLRALLAEDETPATPECKYRAHYPGETCECEARLAAVTTHTRTSTNGNGPDYCAECSEAISEWVPWPCPTRQQGRDFPPEPATPDDVETLAEVVLPALPNHCCDPGDLTDCPYDAHDACGIARAVLVSDWLADRLAAARREGADATLAPVEALIGEWERATGPSRLAFLVAADELSAAIAQGRDAAKGGAS